MGEMADYYLEQEELSEFRNPSGYEERQPIWTDKQGNEYWHWKDITDSHLINIVKLIQRKGISVPDKWTRQLRKRKLTTPASGTLSDTEVVALFNRERDKHLRSLKRDMHS